MSEYFYQLGTYDEAQWLELHRELINDGNEYEAVPPRKIDVCDDKLHSPTRGTYLLTDEEAIKLKQDPRVKFINIDYSRYPEIYKPPPDELQATAPDLVTRYSGTVKHYREFQDSDTPPAVPDSTDVNRTGYQLLRCQQKLDPWVENSYADNFVVEDNVSQLGTGKHVDVIVADDGCWFGHPEFQNNTVLRTDSGVNVEKPAGYTGGNLLPGNGHCDLLDLVFEGPYYIDPDWFNADPGNRLETRWDGTTVPTESAAKSWWSNGSQRSTKFSNIGTVTISGSYTRINCNGSNSAVNQSDGNHGTACNALTFGRSQGWAYNANKWTFNLYGTTGTNIEQGFDIVKIFHTNKPINPQFGTKDPTIMNNSWGYRANKDPDGSTYYYTHRASANNSYTTEPTFISHMGTQGDLGRWKSEMKSNSLVEAQQELIQSGVIFVAAAGNSNQKQVNSDHPDFNNYITTVDGGSLSDSSFFEFGIEVSGTTNRRGFPQQGGAFLDGTGNVVYPVINIGALDDDYKTSKEAKVGYSDRGNSIDVYAPGDGTLAANRLYGDTWPRADTYTSLTYGGGITTDTAFGGTSAACPVAVGLLATVLEYNRDWTWVEIKDWLNNLELQDTADFYFGTETTSPTDANWLDYESIEGGDPRVIYQERFDARFLPGRRRVLSSLRARGLRVRK